MRCCPFGAASLPTSWSSAAHGLAVGGWSAKKGKTFTLYKLPATTGLTNSKAGATKYNQLCRAAGLLPVGCGGGTGSGGPWDCEARRYFGTAECIPMPTSWKCFVDAAMSRATGWKSIVMFDSDGTGSGWNSWLMGYSGGKTVAPTGRDAFHPVCAKIGT